MNNQQTDRRLSDADSHRGGQASDSNKRQTTKWPATPVKPATLAAIPIESLLALTQALKLRPPSFDGVGDFILFLKQFEDVAEANNWTLVQRTPHLRSQLTGDTQGCSHRDSYEEIVEDLHARFWGIQKTCKGQTDSSQDDG